MIGQGADHGRLPRVAGAVLCGGAGSRMGRDKALMVIDDVVQARRVAGALEGAGCWPVVAVGGDGAALRRTGLEVVPDRWPGAGPLGGVVSALEVLGPTGAWAVTVLACDLRWPDARSIAAMWGALRSSSAELAIAVADGERHFHHATWRTSVDEILRARFLGGERSLRGAIAGLEVAEVDVPPWAVFDIDRPRDLAVRRSELGSEPPHLVRRYARCGPEEEERVEVPEIDVEELAALHAAGAPVFDVREPDEFVEGHVPGATLVPLATVPDHLDHFPSTGQVYVICAAGGRSRRAAEYLRANGVEAVNVAGGVRAWMEAGKPLATGPAVR